MDSHLDNHHGVLRSVPPVSPAHNQPISPVHSRRRSLQVITIHPSFEYNQTTKSLSFNLSIFSLLYTFLQHDCIVQPSSQPTMLFWTSKTYDFENIVSTTVGQTWFAVGSVLGGWTTGGNYVLGPGAGSVSIMSAQWADFPRPFPNNLQYGCFLQTSASMSFITRTLTGITVGKSYFVSFWYSCRRYMGSVYNPLWCPPSQTFTVQLDGTTVYSTSPSSFSWVQVSTVTKVATSMSMTVTFQQNTIPFTSSEYDTGINAIVVQKGTSTNAPSGQPSSQPSRMPTQYKMNPTTIPTIATPGKLHPPTAPPTALIYPCPLCSYFQGYSSPYCQCPTASGNEWEWVTCVYSSSTGLFSSSCATSNARYPTGQPTRQPTVLPSASQQQVT